MLANIDGWEIFTDGRVAGFVSFAYGDGYPQSDYAPDANGIYRPIDTPQEGGGFRSVSKQGLVLDQTAMGGTGIHDQGKINMWRVRSGFISNVFGFGVRSQLTREHHACRPTCSSGCSSRTTAGKRTCRTTPTRGRATGSWRAPGGRLTVGRTRTLFSRGATDIDVMYAHRWGVGWPGKLDNNGPTLGMLGFGVLGSGFSSGVIYGTPRAARLAAQRRALRPGPAPGQRILDAHQFLRPEAELTFDRTVRLRLRGKSVVLFANGAYQKVYKDGYCAPVLDPATMKYLPCDQTIVGAGYGGRLELGRLHLGVAGHYGKGLGLYYALEASDAAQDKEGTLRIISGTYVQAQVVVRKFDVFAGWGIAQVYLTDYDKKFKAPDPRDPNNPAAQIFPFSVPKDQMGMNAGVVYHMTPAVHFDLDFFRAQADWYAVNGFAGQKQVVWVGNAGMNVSW